MSSPGDADDAQQPKAKVTGVEHTARSQPDRSTTEGKKDISPLVLTILGAIATGVLAIFNSFSQARQAHQLEEDKLRSTLILKAIEANDPEERRKALAFYVDTGLLNDPEGKIKKIAAQNIPQAPDSTARVWKRIGDSDVKIIDGALVYRSGLLIDPSGAPRAYHPDKKSGLDFLPNAGGPGNWFGIVTDTGSPDGTPVIQSDSDPAPGFYVCATSLADPSKDRTDQRCYVDSSSVPFIDLPSRFGDPSAQVKLGDLAAVYNEGNGKLAFAVYANVGPSRKIGEGSIALAERLGVPSSPKDGGTAKKSILTIVFPVSGAPWPMTEDDINRITGERFKKWGGLERLKRDMPSDPLIE
jgi:hypothetical protein